ncbi:MAG: 16S rRNA (uracil(1498)-N(3))-methyltransferase [Legionellales bacterium RIFCSPHIGHO2_12_FULL_42_9]|nr:MAG: 16S rRNA (uracil(1498)-N(3))-methyltransferase [Legionellales bacterium RIFCSPHIGHO2_12_FULL_42_9]
MREIRIYQPGKYIVGDTVLLTDAASAHLGAALRIQPGAFITLFAGDGWQYISRIISINKRKATVVVTAEQQVNRESNLNLKLIQTIPKGDKMEWIVQKAVELGVASILPLITQHSSYKISAERLLKKYHQWSGIIISACEQCGRNRLPILHHPLKLQDFANQSHPGIGYVAEPKIGQPWCNYTQPTEEVSILIGPEGGFYSTELTAILDLGFKPLKLGPRILRTETAAITAINLLQTIWGDI